jgi:hypothetical protein
MIALRGFGYVLAVIGSLATMFGLWCVAGGLRVVVSRRIDERNQSFRTVIVGVPFVVVGMILLFGGLWLANVSS